jgi:hypothetical protein
MKYNHILHFNVQGFCNYSLSLFAFDITVRCTLTKPQLGELKIGVAKSL